MLCFFTHTVIYIYIRTHYFLLQYSSSNLHVEFCFRFKTTNIKFDPGKPSQALLFASQQPKRILGGRLGSRFDLRNHCTWGTGRKSQPKSRTHTICNLCFLVVFFCFCIFSWNIWMSLNLPRTGQGTWTEP